jgi:hypothetical protein
LPRSGWPVRARSSALTESMTSGEKFILSVAKEARSSALTASKPCVWIFFSCHPGGGTGRRAGLKILWAEMPVRVRFPSGVQTKDQVPCISIDCRGFLFFSDKATQCGIKFMAFRFA